MTAPVHPLTAPLTAAVDSLRGAIGGDGLVVGPFRDDLVRSLSFRPHPRPGRVLGEVDRAGRVAILRILDLLLSEHTFFVANLLTGLEPTISRASHWHKDQQAGDYTCSIHGEPSGDGPWCWRLEGHHLSVSAVVDGGEVTVAPIFLGSNPGVLVKNGRVILDLFAAETGLAKSAISGMDEAARARCRADTTPPEVRHGSSAHVAAPEVEGLLLSDLTPGPRDDLLELADVYLGRCSPDAAHGRRQVIAADELRFAWAGSIDDGEEVNYLLWSASFVAELGNNLHHRERANHIHTVFRLPDAELGA